MAGVRAQQNTMHARFSHSKRAHTEQLVQLDVDRKVFGRLS